MRCATPGPAIGIAAMVEETLKLAPLAVLGVLAPGRIRRFAAVDWILLGLACGMGFQASEDFLRQATSRPSTFVFSPGDGWHYGWSLFGGRFDIGDVASYAGHHVETALVAAGIGLAVRFGSRARLWLWGLPRAAVARRRLRPCRFQRHAGRRGSVHLGSVDGAHVPPLAVVLDRSRLPSGVVAGRPRRRGGHGRRPGPGHPSPILRRDRHRMAEQRQRRASSEPWPQSTAASGPSPAASPAPPEPPEPGGIEAPDQGGPGL